MGFEDDFFKIFKEKSDTRGWVTNFAKKIGVQQGTLSKICTGTNKNPEMKTIAKMIDGVGLSIGYGLSLEQDEKDKYIEKYKDNIDILEKKIIGLEANIELLKDLLSQKEQAQIHKQQIKSCG